MASARNSIRAENKLVIPGLLVNRILGLRRLLIVDHVRRIAGNVCHVQIIVLLQAAGEEPCATRPSIARLAIWTAI